MPFKVGILGAGNIAAKMAQTLYQMPDTECLAIGSRSKEKSEDFAKKYKIPRAYGTYEELANDAELDLIYIATPHSHHFEHAKLCLEAERNVLVEKAFTGNAVQAKELVRLARDRKLLLAEAIWTRYLPMRKTLDELLKNKAMGEALSLTANLAYDNMHLERMYNPELAGGALLDLGVYTINFALMAFGKDLEKIESRVTLTESGVDESETVTFIYKDGKTAELYSSLTEFSDRKGIIKGTGGIIEFENINCCEWLEVRKNDGTTTRLNPPPQITGFEYQVTACRRAIEAGQIECEEMPHSEIIFVMELMDKLRKEWGVIYPFDSFD